MHARALALREECWVHATTPAPSVRFTLDVTVGTDGQVTYAQAEEVDPIALCAEQRIRAWRFPTADAVTRVRVPFHFTRAR